MPTTPEVPAIVWDDAIGPRRAVLVLGHGAGGDHRATLLAELARRLPARGVAVARFDFPYRAAGKKLPDPMPRLEAAYEAVVDTVRRRAGDGPLLLGGKSMGGRVATHLAARHVATDGLVLLGYPLHPAGKKEKLRDVHLPSVPVPTLFVQGTRDDLCDLELLAPVLARCGDRARLHVVDDGDHSLEVRRSSGRTGRDVLDDVEAAIAAFITSIEARRPAP